MKLDSYIKSLGQAIGTKIFINIYLNQYKGVMPIDAKKIWHDDLVNTQMEFKDNNEYEVTKAYPEIGGGFNGSILISIFVSERKEAA